MQFPLVPPNLTVALATTKDLRDFYRTKVLEYSQLLEQAQSQLVHAEALLTGLEQLQQSPIASEPSIIHAATETNGKSGSNGNGFNNHKLAIELNGTKPEQAPALAVTVTNLEVELLPLYQDTDLPSAITSLLQEHDGTILRLDFIVRTLYGKLTASQFEVISQRVLQILEQGVSEGRWHKDPYPHANNADCYTWSLESLSNEFINNDEPEVEDVATPDEILTNSDQLENEDDSINEKDKIVTKEDILDLVNSRKLTVDKMRQLAREQKFFGYGSVKYPESFASYFVKNSLTVGALLDFLTRDSFKIQF